MEIKDMSWRMLVDLAKKIIREILSRNKVTFHPEKWKNSPLKLYLQAFNELNSEGIEIPANVKRYFTESVEFIPSEWTPEVFEKLPDKELIVKLDLLKTVYSERGENPQDEEIINAYLLLKKEFEKRKIEFISNEKLEVAVERIEEGIRPAFGSPGGKRFLAKTICSYIPDHKIYVEPFIGGGGRFSLLKNQVKSK